MNPSVLSAKAVFDQAHEIDSPAERQAYVDRVCANDPELRQKVEALLRAYDAAGSFLEKPAGPLLESVADQPGSNTPAVLDGAETIAPAPAAESTPGTEGPGTQIGPYRLVRELGEGGMGAVYLAEQDKPMRRQVALKIIKPGMDSAQVIARFEAERQALTMMDHVNVARVYDAGTTERGLPYFVMELVQGVPMTRFCDENTLTIRQRLALCATVCQAIQHAHQKGIMHRDIKPSNVLVALQDGTPVPKVIDFGLAKAIEQPLTDQSQVTQEGAILGTLKYMSPEQAGLSNEGIDTRTDVYSLGVVLYELLTGTTPLDLGKARGEGFLEAVMRIHQEEAPKPSTRVAALGGALPAIAAARRTEPARLAKQLRGELDWIVLKALEKDRNRRYETASGFARDIERYLNDEPVEACPPSTRYRLGKFARKHRGLLATVGGFMALLVLGVAGLTWGLVEVNDAKLGEKKQRESAENALFREEQERKKAETQQKKAEAAEKRTRKANALTWAGIRLLTQTSTKLGDTEKRILRNMQEEYRRLEPDASRDRRATAAETAYRVAMLEAARGAHAEAEASYRTAIGLYQKLAGDYKHEPEYRNELARCTFDLGHLLRKQGNATEAAAAFEQALELHNDVVADFPDEPAYWREVADAYNELGTLRRRAKDFAKAASALREAVRIGEKVAADRPGSSPAESQYRINLGAGYHNLGNVVRDKRDPETALTWYAKAIKVLDPIDPSRPEKATEYLRNAHWDRANALDQLSRHTQASKDWQRAIDLDAGPAREHLKRFLAASAMEEKLKNQAKASGAFLYEAAALNARAAKAAKDEDELDLGTRYGRRALDLLKQARAAGWFRDPQRVKQLKMDNDFASLPRSEFQPFLESLQAGNGANDPSDKK